MGNKSPFYRGIERKKEKVGVKAPLILSVQEECRDWPVWALRKKSTQGGNKKK